MSEWKRFQFFYYDAAHARCQLRLLCCLRDGGGFGEILLG